MALVTLPFNDGPDAGPIVVAAPIVENSGCVYTTAAKHRPFAARIPDASSFFRIDNTTGSTTTHSGSVYFSIRANPGSGSARLLSFATATNALRMIIRANFTGVIQIIDGASTVMAATVATFTVGQWHRLDWQLDATVATAPTLTVRFFTNPDDTGTGEQISWAASGIVGEMTRYQLHSQGNAGWAADFDTFRAINGLTWLGPPKTALLIENFATDDFAVWEDVIAGGAVRNGQLVMPYLNSGPTRQTVASWDLTESAFHTKVAHVPNPGNETYFGIGTSGSAVFGGDQQQFVIAAMTIFFRELVAGVANDTSMVYDPTEMRWLRLRHAGTSVFWETSPDGVTWTQRRTKVQGFAPTAHRVKFTAFNTTADDDASATFDNLNTLTPSEAPGGPTLYTVAGCLNVMAGSVGRTATAAANDAAGTTGLTLASALNALAGTTGLTETAAANRLAGTSGHTLLAALRAHVESGA